MLLVCCFRESWDLFLFFPNFGGNLLKCTFFHNQFPASKDTNYNLFNHSTENIPLIRCWLLGFNRIQWWPNKIQQDSIWNTWVHLSPLLLNRPDLRQLSVLPNNYHTSLKSFIASWHRKSQPIFPPICPNFCILLIYTSTNPETNPETPSHCSVSSTDKTLISLDPKTYSINL